MNNERYNQIIDEAYEDYLKNFIEPICPPNLDVQPSYYEPMTKDWFVKSAKERGSRGDEFSEKWGVKIEERELSDDARNIFFLAKMNPLKQITVTYKGEKIEVYE